MGNSVLLEKNDRIAIIYLNEPDSLNALSIQLKKDLHQALKIVESDNEIHVVILAGKGRSFCAGGDIKAMANALEKTYNPLEIKRNMDESARLVENIRRMPKLTIAAVQGYVAGAGISIALGSDMIVAEEGTKFFLSFKNVGLIPDLGLHYHLPRILGEWKAKEWIWKGAAITAEEGKTLGFVREIVPKGYGYEKACEYAQELIEGPVQSYIYSKLIINSSSNLRIEDVQKLENDAQTILRGTQDHQEGVRAFLERRPPNFSGN